MRSSKEQNPLWLRLIDSIDYRLTFQIGLFAVLTLPIAYRIFGNTEEVIKELFVDLWQLALAIIVVNRWNRRREVASTKERLQVQLGSVDLGIAHSALIELRKKGWLIDGSLRTINLAKANLQELNLEEADLEGSFFRWANMKGTILRRANLMGAVLRDADLEGAKMQRALLTHADLSDANLDGANLRGADLQAALLTPHSFTERTLLPDGSQWSPDVDLTQFTNLHHPDFVNYRLKNYTGIEWH